MRKKTNQGVLQSYIPLFKNTFKHQLLIGLRRLGLKSFDNKMDLARLRSQKIMLCLFFYGIYAGMVVSELHTTCIQMVYSVHIIVYI